jgi:hypothetical protein
MITEEEGSPPINHDDVEGLSFEEASAYIGEMKSDLGFE